MKLDTAVPEKAIDLSGLRCPHLIIAIIQALKTIENGQILQVIATDPNAPSNTTAWVRQSRHTLIDMFDESSCFVFLIRRDHEITAPGPGT